MTYIKDINFDELKSAERILENGFDTGKINKKGVSLLSKLFFSKGMKTQEAKKRLVEFCYKNSSGFNDIMYRGLIEDAIKTGKKYYLKQSDTVCITKNELDIIRSLPVKYAKVLFVLLVLSKYNHDHNVKIGSKEEDATTRGYCCYDNTRKILSIAKITMSNDDIDKMGQFFIKHQYLYYDISEKKGRMPFEIWKILFAEDIGEIEIEVTDMDNIISFLPAFCERCGKTIERVGRQKYCEECTIKINRENTNKRKLKYSHGNCV